MPLNTKNAGTKLDVAGVEEPTRDLAGPAKAGVADLAALRALIDDADLKLLRLLDERMQLAVRAGRLKVVVGDQVREDAVLARIGSRRYGLLDPSFLRPLFRGILDESRALQERRFRLAGFQGERGAWSELAVRHHDSSLVAMPCREFRDVFQAVASGALDLGVVPVENSIEGPVGEVNDLLAETDLRLIAEVRVPIRHCLLTLPGTDPRGIRAVYSHPQALGQCRSFIALHGLEPRPFYDTAGAARWLAAERPQSAAVVAGALAADLYGLEVVKEGIEDHAANTTRFLVLSRTGGQSGRKCSLVFTAVHRAGSLLDVLRVFADEGLNLTRIESRPLRRDPGAFAFLLDFVGADDVAHVARAFAQLPDHTLKFNVLGFYEPAEVPTTA